MVAERESPRAETEPGKITDMPLNAAISRVNKTIEKYHEKDDVWPCPVLAMKKILSEALKITPSDVYYAYDRARSNEEIVLLKIEDNRARSRFYFSEDMVRAFGVWMWAKENRKDIQQIKEELGDLAFANLIITKSNRTRYREVEPDEFSASDQASDDRDNIFASSGERRGPVPGQVKPDDFPELELLKKRKDLEKLAVWDKDALGKLQGSLPRLFESIDTRRAPAELVEAVMFIHFFRNKAKWRVGEEVKTFAFKGALQSCLIYLEKYPELKNLAQLFPVVYVNYLNRNGSS